MLVIFAESMLSEGMNGQKQSWETIHEAFSANARLASGLWGI